MIKKPFRYLREQASQQLIRYYLSGRFQADEAITITSPPRSGSTLLAQILAAIPKSCISFESLHLKQIPEAAAAEFTWRTYVEPEYVEPELEWSRDQAFLQRVFEGWVVNQWTSREIAVNEAIQACQICSC